MPSPDPSSVPERGFELIAEIFFSALELPAEARHGYVVAACQGDGEVEREVLAMLGAHETGMPLLLEDGPRTRPSHPELGIGDLAPGTRIGPWGIERLVGQGGMGEVYRGERVDGAYRQTVAIKVLRPGYRTAETVRRFRVEREALARLVHPAIAALLDGGTLEDGRPYLVLQYVDGVPLTGYCQARHLSIDDRLRLFVRVVRAVEFAHSRLVIHRDLKASNILIEADGTPRLLDFGIARMQDPTLDPSLVRPTRPDSRLLTPEHAAPEQIRGEPCDTRTDVYGLGVLLFELLTDRAPFSAENRSLLDLERDVLETEAPLPSAVVATPALKRTLRGDLDHITQMTLRKEPDRRYSSAAQLADDIERYLTGRPVLAQPDRLGYRARKFFLRNRALVLGGTVVTLLLLAFAISATIQARRLERERNRAERERAVAADMVQILTTLFERANPRKVPGGDTVRVAALLDEAERQIDGLADAPERQAALLRTVGQMHQARGEYARAEALLRRSAELQWKTGGPDDLDAARTYHELATLVLEYRGGRAALPMFDSSLARFRRLGEAASSELRTALIDLATVTGDSENRQALLNEEARLEARLPGVDSMTIAARLHTQAVDLLGHSRPVEAIALFQATLDIVNAQPTPDPEIRATVKNNIASALAQSGQLEEAARLQRQQFEDALRMRVRPDALAGAHERLAVTLANLGQFEEAEQLERRAVALFREGLAPDNPLIWSALRNLGLIVAMEHREREGLMLFDSAMAQARAANAAPASVAYLTGQRVPMLLRLGRIAEAGSSAALADSVLQGTVPLGDYRRSDAARWTAMAAYARGDYPAAARAAGALVEMQADPDPGNRRSWGQATCLLGVVLTARGQRVEARPLLEQGCPLHDAWGWADPLISAWGRAALREVQQH